MVSIPVWCNYQTITHSRGKRLADVSIPVWCNYQNYTKSHEIDTTILFQFQYGAIISYGKSKDTTFQKKVSIPVWCNYQTFGTVIDLPEERFNSSMVQLLGKRRRLSNLYRNRFQFQYGAIIRNEKIHIQENINGFNSSMVQLLAVSSAAWAVTKRFQFQYGAIISQLQVWQIPGHLSFNSSMVQLLEIKYKPDTQYVFSFNSSMVQLLVQYIFHQKAFF